MRSASACLALIAIAAVLPVAAAEPPTATAVVCTSIQNNSCEGADVKFSSDVGKLWGFSQVANVPDKLVHVWFYKDKELGRLEMRPPNAPRWRTWSNVTIAKNMVGAWRLEARDGSGKILATFAFTIE